MEATSENAAAVRRALWWFGVAWVVVLFPFSVSRRQIGSGAEINPVHIAGALAMVGAGLLMQRSSLPPLLRGAWTVPGLIVTAGVIAEVMGSDLDPWVALFAPAYVLLLERTSTALGFRRGRTAARATVVAWITVAATLGGAVMPDVDVPTWGVFALGLLAIATTFVFLITALQLHRTVVEQLRRVAGPTAADVARAAPQV